MDYVEGLFPQDAGWKLVVFKVVMRGTMNQEATENRAMCYIRLGLPIFSIKF